MELIEKQQAIDAVTNELDMIDHVPQWVFDRLEKRLKQLPPAQPHTYRGVTLNDVMMYFDSLDGNEDAWTEFCSCLECRGWGLYHIRSATDKNVGSKISREPLELARAIDGLTEWQKHVQTDSNIDRDITVAIEALKAQLGTNLAEVGTDTISRQAVIDAIENAFDRETILNRFVRKIAISAVRLLPSAQPEIIRCKDCKEYDPIYTGGAGVCGHWNAKTESNAYCSYADRRKG